MDFGALALLLGEVWRVLARGGGNWIDWIIVFLVLAGVVHGFLVGLTGMIAPAICFCAGVYLMGDESFVAAVGQRMEAGTLAAMAVILAASLGAGALLRMLLRDFTRASFPLLVLDRVGGVLVSLVVVALGVSLSLGVLAEVSSPATRVEIQNSRVAATTLLVAENLGPVKRALEVLKERAGRAAAAAVKEAAGVGGER